MNYKIYSKAKENQSKESARSLKWKNEKLKQENETLKSIFSSMAQVQASTFPSRDRFFNGNTWGDRRGIRPRGRYQTRSHFHQAGPVFRRFDGYGQNQHRTHPFANRSRGNFRSFHGRRGQNFRRGYDRSYHHNNYGYDHFERY